MEYRRHGKNQHLNWIKPDIALTRSALTGIWCLGLAGFAIALISLGKAPVYPPIYMAVAILSCILLGIPLLAALARAEDCAGGAAMGSDDKLAEMRDQLLHVSRLSAMGEMASGLAHELNQPLAATTNFLGAAEMLLNEDPVSPAQVRNLIQLASSQALRAGSIIQRVRTFATRGDVETRVEYPDQIVFEAVSLMFMSVERNSVRISYDFADNIPPILVDRVQIQQVLANLIRNAIEAFESSDTPYREIILGARPVSEEMVEISVADNGPGIMPAFLAAAHQPFMSTKAHGMGVGLSICRRIVEAHGGALYVENRQTGGAMVRFTVRGLNETEWAAQ